MSKKIEVHGKPHGFTSAHASSVSVVENDLEKCESVLVWRENDRAFLEFAYPTGSMRVKRYLKESYWNDILQRHYKFNKPLGDRLEYEDAPFHIKGKGWIVQVCPKKNNCTHNELLALKGHLINVGGKNYKVKGAECMEGACGYKGTVGFLLEDKFLLADLPPAKTINPNITIGPKDLPHPAPCDDMRPAPGVSIKVKETKPDDYWAYPKPVSTEPGYKTLAGIVDHFLKNPPKVPDDAMIQKWRDTGLLRNAVKSGSYEEKMLVTLLENQKRQWIKENGL